MSKFAKNRDTTGIKPGKSRDSNIYNFPQIMGKKRYQTTRYGSPKRGNLMHFGKLFRLYRYRQNSAQRSATAQHKVVALSISIYFRYIGEVSIRNSCKRAAAIVSVRAFFHVRNKKITCRAFYCRGPPINPNSQKFRLIGGK